MKGEIIEVILILIIIGIQSYIFYEVFNKIKIYKYIFPNTSSLKISKIYIPINEFQKLTPTEILSNLDLYKEKKPKFNYDDEGRLILINDELINTENSYENIEEKLEVNIIEFETHKNKVFEKIIFSINNYLIRNRGASSDFNLIKDISERNTNAIEEDISSSVGVPLYLGLMGTMLGIVIALFNMPDLNSNFGSVETGQKLDEGIGMLIGGVKIAMIASFVGLLLTILNSARNFKTAKSYNEAQKNEFYTFVQIELLPIINQGLASTLESLQRNLFKFNDEFSSNLSGLSGIFDSNIRAIEVQKELLETIDKTKVAEITKYNVKVLQQLDLSVNQFEKFNSYLTNVNLFVENSQNMVSKTNELLSRTDNFKSIAENLENKLNQSQNLIDFLSQHYVKLEEHKNLTSNAVADVGFAISDTFKDLREHIQKSTEAVKNFSIEETDLLRKALSEGKTNLGNLEHLASLKSDVSQIKSNNSTQTIQLKHSVDELNNNMAKAVRILNELEKTSFTSRAKGITSSIKNLFNSK